jgi:hypothetical protein
VGRGLALPTPGNGHGAGSKAAPKPASLRERIQHEQAPVRTAAHLEAEAKHVEFRNL